MDAGPEPHENSRPRLLLVPQLTELEWVIKPVLEEWAEVASYDAPGVGAEPPADDFGSEAIGDRGLDELDRRGWDRCVLVVDEFGAAAAARIASRRPEAVEALAFGHARLSNSLERDGAPINSEVYAACASLVRADPRTFIRQLFMLTQGEQQRGGYGEELVDDYLRRVPVDLLVRFWETRPDESESIGRVLGDLDAAVFLAKHEGCLLFTPEGYDAAKAALPGARSTSFSDKPSASPEFAEALKTFCLDLEPAPAESRL
jgi:pimeloyl-ACP methyl ester carboxylesterase